MDNILSSEFDYLGEDLVGDGNNCSPPVKTLDDLSNENYWFISPRYGWCPELDESESLENLSSEKEGDDSFKKEKHLRTSQSQIAFSQQSYRQLDFLQRDAYDQFMTRHLQHYGYFTGRNASFRDNFKTLQDWRRNYDVRLSGQRSLSVVEEQLGKNGRHLHNKMIEGAFFSGESELPDDLLHRTTQLVFQYQAGRKIPKLREPRNLYALTKEAGPQQATRWPSHLQVVCPAVRFLDVSPSTPEPMHKLTGKEPTPSVRGSQLGQVIYFNDPGRDIYFMRSRVAGCRLAMRSMTLTPPDYAEDNYTLEFESRFESGNLLKVDRISDFDYELTLRTDLYTSKHTQWYFFRVRNMRPGKAYRFTIVNLMKPSSLYNHGMRPVFYSEMNAKKNKVGWIRWGTNVRYYRNNLCSRDGRYYYSLTWQCEFPFKGDACYFAHCYPYTYTDLQEYLLDLANDPVRSRFCKQRVLCRTLAGNLVYILTITSPSRNPEISRAKKAVVLSARVHPGETNASWMMKGYLDFLTGNSADAKLLRDTFIFKIVPMLNPDGVIVGNYRCSLAGRDLNRNYKSVLKDSFPSIWHTKTMVKRLRAEREVVLYCDLHGHSRKNNIFIYGCENKHQPQKRFKERIFPLMLSKNAHQSFSFDSCKYKVQKSKEGTGRIVMWYMGIMNSYTLEATFGGTSLPGSRKDTHLSIRDLEMIGYHFCDTLLDYCDPDDSKREACMKELQDRMRRQILKKLRLQGRGAEDINLDDYISDMESDTSGSDSSCDDGLPVHLLAIAPKLQRTKKLRTRRERSKVTPSKSTTQITTDTSKQISHSARASGDKAKTVRYSQTLGKKREDHSVATRHGASSAAAEDRSGVSDRAAKKLPTVSLKYVDPFVNPFLGYLFGRSKFGGQRSDYLEVLTSAYMRSGVLGAPDPKKNYPLKYRNGSAGNAPEGNFAVQYLANRLGCMSESEESKPSSPLMRNASCQWSPQPGSATQSESDDEQDITKEAILAEEQYEILRQSALKRQLSAGQQRLLAQKHLEAVAAMQPGRGGGKSNQRITSAASDRVSNRSAVKRHPNPFEDRSEPFAQDFTIVTSGTDSVRALSRAASASNVASRKASDFRSSGRPEAPSNGEKVLLQASTLLPDTQAPTASHRSSSRPVSSHIKPTIQKRSSHALPAETSVTVDSVPVSNTPPTTETTLTVNDQVQSFVIPSEQTMKTVTDFAMGGGEAAVLHTVSSNDNEKIALGDTKLSENADMKSRPLIWAGGEGRQEQHGFGHTSRVIQSNRQRFEEANLIKDGHARKRQTSRHSPQPFPTHRSDSDVIEAVKATRLEQHSSDFSITLPTRMKALNQEEMKAVIQGELALHRTPETTSIPQGIKKSTAVIMETDPEKLTVKSNRYFVKQSTPDTVAEVHSNLHRAKSYQSSDESFFGMSDRIGLAMVPKGGGRVPPVVANIAELRRSLMGHTRESTTEQPRKAQPVAPSKSSEAEIFNACEDGIPFSQRPKRRNPAGRHRTGSLTEHDEQSRQSKVDHLSDVHETLKRDTQRRLQPLGGDDELLSDDNVDTLSTVATVPDAKSRYHRHHVGIRKASMKLDELRSQRSFDDVDVPAASVNVSKPGSAGRSYTQGNTTIEKQSDTSLTNIRIGSRTTERITHVIDHWQEAHQKHDNIVASGVPSRSTPSISSSTTATISAVSLNLKGDADDRTCVTTPALASRPVPPILRYLSAKQGQNKKK